jgi:hypothetical protein
VRFKYNIRCREKIHLIFEVQFYSKFRRYELIFSKLGRFKLCGGKFSRSKFIRSKFGHSKFSRFKLVLFAITVEGCPRN